MKKKVKCDNEKCGAEIAVMDLDVKVYGGIDQKLWFFCSAGCCLEKIFGIRRDNNKVS